MERKATQDIKKKLGALILAAFIALSCARGNIIRYSPEESQKRVEELEEALQESQQQLEHALEIIDSLENCP